MAEKISGKIQYLNEKDGQWGKSYNVKIDGETYYLQGKFPPRGIDAGDTVELEWAYKGNFKIVEKNSLRKLEGGVAPPTQPSTGGTSAPARPAAAPTKAGNYNDDRDKRITKMASLNTSLEFLKFAKENDTLPVPKAKNAGYGYLYDLWLDEAAKLYELNTGEKWELPQFDVEAEAPKHTKKATKRAAPPAPPAEDEWDDGEFRDDDIPF